MTWQVSLALRGDLQNYLNAEGKAGRKAVFGVVNRRKTSLKTNLRKQVFRATNSQRLANTVRDWINKEKEFAKNITAYVFSKALYKRPRGLVDLITLLDEGETVHARGGKALAIPLKAAGKGGGVKHDPVSRQPSDWPAGTFAMIPSKDKKTALLVFKEGSKKGQAAFMLVKRTRHTRKISIKKAYDRSVRNIDQAVATTWEKESIKNARRFDVTR